MRRLWHEIRRVVRRGLHDSRVWDTTRELAPSSVRIQRVFDDDLEGPELGESRHDRRILLCQHVRQRPVVRGEVPAVAIDQRTPMVHGTVERNRIEGVAEGKLEPKTGFDVAGTRRRHRRQRQRTRPGVRENSGDRHSGQPCCRPRPSLKDDAKPERCRHRETEGAEHPEPRGYSNPVGARQEHQPRVRRLVDRWRVHQRR